ncbi:MAG TPA: hypothetical protein ENG58_03635, partial [Thermotogales bacterium]|nr:hypothetical protein [Thermotogales bacterium]
MWENFFIFLMPAFLSILILSSCSGGFGPPESGKFIAVAGGAEGLLILDVSDPHNPKLVGYFNTDGWAESVHVSGDYAYIADERNGLVIVDISDPHNPQLVGHYDTDG